MKDRIKLLRHETGLTQEQFAAKYNIPVRTLQNWEQGKGEPAIYFISLLEQIVYKTEPATKNDIYIIQWKVHLIKYGNDELRKLYTKHESLVDDMLKRRASLIEQAYKLGEFFMLFNNALQDIDSYRILHNFVSQMRTILNSIYQSINDYSEEQFLKEIYNKQEDTNL